MKFPIGRVIACVSLLFSFTSAWERLEAANIIHVPTDQPTIQSAINAAANGDTVQVATGTYVENLNFSGKAITITSGQGPAVTIIDGNQAGSVVTFASGEGSQSVLNGFTIRNGNATASIAEGGGVNITNSSPTITGNVIINNSAANGGGGISISGGSPLIQSNLIKNNGQTMGYSGGVGGGGIAIVGTSSAQVLNNTISNNSWNSSSGGGITLFAAGTPTLANNIVSYNTAYSQGGGFNIVNQSDAAIVQNLIVGNSAATGGGLYWLVPSGGRGPFLINNTIYGNPSPQGSGVFADGFDAQSEMINNIIVAASGQTSVVCGSFTTSVPVFTTNDVFSNSGLAYGGTCGNPTGLSGNISADPLFVNADGGDFHLQRGSPAIDTGTNGNIMPQTDLDGTPRPLDATGKGIAIIDMGVYEAVPDLTPPATVASTTPTPGAAGWNTSNVSVTLTATDNPGGSGVANIRYSLSGAQTSGVVIAGNPVIFSISAEGTTTVGYFATDVAGNVESTKSLTVKIDKTAPVTVAAAMPVPNAAGWNSNNVTVTLNSTDNTGGSGVQSISYSLSGAQAGSAVVAGNSATISMTAEGTTTVSYSATDVAGNVESTKSLTIKIDKTAPVTAAAATPTPNAAGWNSNNVTVLLNSTDNAAGSGVQGISYSLSGAQTGSAVVAGNSAAISITAEGTTTVSYFATDVAGNVESTKYLTSQIDKTAPVISGMPVRACTLTPPKHQLVQVANVTASDALSGLASLNLIASRNPPGAPGDIVISGGTVQLRAVRGAVYTVVATASDIAGNTTTATATCSVPK